MFIEEERVCANVDCKNKFTAKVYNTIYCSAECRKIVTNKKLLENYYEKKKNRQTKRICKTDGCDTILSRYNDEKICEACKKKDSLKDLFLGVGMSKN